MRFQFAADIVRDGIAEMAGYYEIGEDMKLRKLVDPSAEFQLRTFSKPSLDYQTLSIAKGNPQFDQPLPSGWGARHSRTHYRA